MGWPISSSGAYPNIDSMPAVRHEDGARLVDDDDPVGGGIEQIDVARRILRGRAGVGGDHEQ